MYIEQINFERTGGFTGIRLAADIELNELPEDQKHEILELLDDMDFDELSEKTSGATPMPDGFVYSVSVISKEHEYQVTVGESAISNEMQQLIEILEDIAKSKARKK